MILKTIKDVSLGILFPRVCPVCGRVLTEEENAVINDGRFEKMKIFYNNADIKEDMNSPCFKVIQKEMNNPYICRYCYAGLGFVNNPKCMKCGRPLEDDTKELCPDCSHKRRHYDSGMALLKHDDNARKIIYGLKYGNIRENADFFAREAALRLGGRIMRLAPEVIIPVPLHKTKLHARGFNQAGLIAQKLSENMFDIYGVRIPVDAEMLVRSTKTNPQKELSAEKRAENVRGKFTVCAMQEQKELSAGRYTESVRGRSDACAMQEQKELSAEKCAENTRGKFGKYIMQEQKELSAERYTENVRGRSAACTMQEIEEEKSTTERTGHMYGKDGKENKALYGHGIYSRVLLLDDIYTSGATINECALTLKAAGVGRVDFIAMSIV